MAQTVCPFDWRYGSEEMKQLFAREAWLQRLLEVEAALLWGLVKAGFAPREAAEEVEKAVKEKRVSIERVDELERKLRHDVMAVAVALAEAVGGEASRYVHLGATSYDVVDTAWALVIRDALGIVLSKLSKVISKLSELAQEHRETLMVGRTHGQHALPITLGFKLANYAYELSRSIERLVDCSKRVVRAKVAGAVGTMAAWDGRGFEVEEEVCARLGLQPHAISTQVAPRDGFAELLACLAILASQLDRLATEIRELMRPEIKELAEGVAREQVGSSTMPHKENPVTSERISSLAKLVRSLVVAALENIPLWHERDLTNSACERVIIPHAFLAVDEMLDCTFKVLENLRVYPENMKRNLMLTKGANMAEAVMVYLVLKKGMARHEAHHALQEAARKAVAEGKSLAEAVAEHPVLGKILSKREVEEILRPENYLGMTSALIERALAYARRAQKLVDEYHHGAI